MKQKLGFVSLLFALNGLAPAFAQWEDFSLPSRGYPVCVEAFGRQVMMLNKNSDAYPLMQMQVDLLDLDSRQYTLLRSYTAGQRVSANAFRFHNGLAIVADGKVEHITPQGEVTDLTPRTSGIGAFASDGVKLYELHNQTLYVLSDLSQNWQEVSRRSELAGLGFGHGVVYASGKTLWPSIDMWVILPNGGLASPTFIPRGSLFVDPHRMMAEGSSAYFTVEYTPGTGWKDALVEIKETCEMTLYEIPAELGFEYYFPVAVNDDRILIGGIYSFSNSYRTSGLVEYYPMTDTWQPFEPNGPFGGYVYPVLLDIKVADPLLLVFWETGSRRHLSVLAPQPVARCKAVQLEVGSDCTALVSPSLLNDGSYDPNGYAITLSVDPQGALPLGHQTVTLTVANSVGGCSRCSSDVWVKDTRPPAIAPFSTALQVVSQVPIAVTLPVPEVQDACAVVSQGNDAPDLFPIGQTTVTFWATDGSGNRGQTTLSVVVELPSQALADLLNSLPGMGLDPDIENPLSALLEAAIAALGKGSTAAAQNQLNATLRIIEAQTGKSLAPDIAAELTLSIQAVLKAIKA
ncbi:MAG: HYR domain-containing protein [Acidobacteria bacterium]|nr:MAG: HYR domain-containing protein [Acidobacteriota bacterium]